MVSRLHGYLILLTMTDPDYQESSSQHLICIYKFMKTQKPNPLNVFKFSNQAQILGQNQKGSKTTKLNFQTYTFTKDNIFHNVNFNINRIVQYFNFLVLLSFLLVDLQICVLLSIFMKNRCDNIDLYIYKLLRYGK